MEEMANFEEFLYKTEEEFHKFGALKIKPPKKWLEKICVHTQETFNHKLVSPKIQNALKLTDGIYKLTNNPLEQGDEMKRKRMSVKVKIFGLSKIWNRYGYKHL